MALEPFATVAELREHPAMGDIDTAEGEYALARASAAIREHTRQTINLVEDDVEVHDGGGRSMLLLRELPIGEVSQVTVDGETFDDWYVTEHGALHRTDDDVWPCREKVEVTYTHGYAEIPDGIVQATLELAALFAENPTKAQSERVGHAAVTHMIAGGGGESSDKSVLARLDGRFRVSP